MAGYRCRNRYSNYFILFENNSLIFLGKQMKVKVKNQYLTWWNEYVSIIIYYLILTTLELKASILIPQFLQM